MVLIVHVLDRLGNSIHVVVNIFEDGCTYRIGFEYTAVTNLDLRNRNSIENRFVVSFDLDLLKFRIDEKRFIFTAETVTVLRHIIMLVHK